MVPPIYVWPADMINIQEIAFPLYTRTQLIRFLKKPTSSRICLLHVNKTKTRLSSPVFPQKKWPDRETICFAKVVYFHKNENSHRTRLIRLLALKYDTLAHTVKTIFSALKSHYTCITVVNFLNRSILGNGHFYF